MQQSASTVGRFAPTPSGRMHLGNVFAALISFLSAKSQKGAWLLRMEDLDTLRTKEEYAEALRQDLKWLGLIWDEETPKQSLRTKAYERCFAQLLEESLLYPCYCTRSQLHSINAPHLSDGTYVYPGTCRSLHHPPVGRLGAWRVKVPDKSWELTDLCQGCFSQNLATDCGDFVVRRADGVFVYQLAVTVDDGDFGVTEVVRGADLLSSAPRQMYLQSLLGFAHPTYGHVPMLLSQDGRRLSKRDKDLDLGVLRLHKKPEEILGVLAYASGLTEKSTPISSQELAAEFSWERLRKEDIFLPANLL